MTIINREACEQCALGLVCTQANFAVTLWSCMRCGRKYAGWGTEDKSGLANVQEVNCCPKWEGVRRVGRCQWCVKESNNAPSAGREINWEKESLLRIAQRAKYVKLD